MDLGFERVAHRTDSVALTDVKVDGQLDVVLEILGAPDPSLEARVAPESTGAGSSSLTPDGTGSSRTCERCLGRPSVGLSDGKTNVTAKLGKGTSVLDWSALLLMYGKLHAGILGVAARAAGSRPDA